MTLRSGTGQACASCKFQRRRCTPQCLLAPFFPADQPHVFQSVHRLFGVKHIQKLLKEIHPDQRAAAMESVKYHAAMREKNPVLGCLAQTNSLYHQIQRAEEELHAVLQELLHQKQLEQNNTNGNGNCNTNNYYQSQLQLGMASQEYNHNPTSCSNEFESLWMQSQMAMPIQEQSVQDYNEMCPFSDNADDKHSYIGPKEVYDESSLESVRDSRQSEQVAENELKNAAACFSLTSFN